MDVVVDVEHRAADVVGRRRAQEGDQPGDLLDARHAAEGQPETSKVCKAVIGETEGPGATPFTSTPAGAVFPRRSFDEGVEATLLRDVLRAGAA